ncbi:hypothetical protein V9T40_013005 [Parthenolecanium corni]|uniref:Amino acid transporter transmembrane domain-containing protein n=1 Tax=Parthenolecanium corni TaxID=536013 RepID=A0AAN9TBX1_9HEMI
MSNLESNRAATLIGMSPKPPQGESEKHKECDTDKKDGITSFGATVHILRGSIGSGFLLMPFLMKNLGYVTGTVVILTVATFYYHIVHVLVSTEDKVCRQLKIDQLSYIELAEEVFKFSPFPLNKFRRINRYCLYLLFGIPTTNASFLVLIANGVQIIGKFFGVELKTWHIISVVIIPLTLLCMSRKVLEILVPYSNLTNICSFLIAFIVIATSISHRAKWATVQPFGNAAYIPESVAICAKTFRFTALVLAIKHHMNHPEKYTHTFGPVNVAASILIIFYYSFGVILYVSYGDEVQGNVLLNMPNQNYLTDSINLLYTVTMSVAYVIVFYGRIDNLWSGVVKQKFANKSYGYLVENGFYIGFNVFTYLIAVALPDFAIITAVSGTMAIPLELALPLVMDLVIRSKNGELNYWVISKNVIVIGGSVVLCILSAKNLILEIINMN